MPRRPRHRRPRSESGTERVGEDVGELAGRRRQHRGTQRHQRRGVASILLAHLLAQARADGYARASLETGTMDYFEPARRLYLGAGFRPCPPFGRYVEDPNSMFLSLRL